MSADGSDYFTAERVALQRREIEEHGFVADEFLAEDPDCPVFGINLACAYPFPANVEAAYTRLADGLARLDEGAYVYPFWETHVTIMTFINFSRHQRPAPAQAAALGAELGPIAGLLETLFDREPVQPFQLEFRPPVLTRKAAILPVANPTGEIPRLRRRAGQLLESNPDLHQRMIAAGLNVPGIIHSTVMRFKRTPPDASRLTAGFDAVAAATAPFAVTVRELFLTVETKPYMRGGEIMRRFPLATPA